jgi:hypothetical protein
MEDYGSIFTALTINLMELTIKGLTVTTTATATTRIQDATTGATSGGVTMVITGGTVIEDILITIIS